MLFVRVTPNAGADRIEAVERRDDGRSVLRLRVAAAPDRGRANKAAITLVADAFGLSRSAVRIESGETSRLKTLHLSGAPGQLAALAENLFQTHG
jgi:uncharacterized protein